MKMTNPVQEGEEAVKVGFNPVNTGTVLVKELAGGRFHLQVGAFVYIILVFEANTGVRLEA